MAKLVYGELANSVRYLPDLQVFRKSIVGLNKFIKMRCILANDGEEASIHLAYAAFSSKPEETWHKTRCEASFGDQSYPCSF